MTVGHCLGDHGTETNNFDSVKRSLTPGMRVCLPAIESDATRIGVANTYL